jgi:peptidoglycan/LPS O-acetylase OafA/YrhL
MLFLGRISYGIFLWQLVFLDGYYKWSHTRLGTGNFWVVISIPLFGSIAVATISYYLVERPLMRLRPRLGRAPSAPSMPVPVIESASNDVDEHACTESPASGQAG